MAPLPSSLSTEHRRRRCSKAQMCFFNILHIISVFPTADVTDNKPLRNDKNICENQGFVVDLKSDSLVTDDSELAVEEERATVHSEISHVGDQSSGIHYVNGVSENDKPRDEGYLGLLIEAAQLILSHDSEQQPNRKTEPENIEASGGEPKRKLEYWTAEWYAEFDDTSPVVKSKRGRNQVLPHKYRDSVVDRWPSNHRSISHAAVRSKRRLK